MGNLNFSRQHHARIHEQNETHTIISFLDNAVGADPQPATTPWSRGLVVALREDTMTVEILAEYDHPHRGHAFRRGSTQILPNGNVFMGTYLIHRSVLDKVSCSVYILEMETNKTQDGQNRHYNLSILQMESSSWKLNSSSES